MDDRNQIQKLDLIEHFKLVLISRNIESEHQV